MGIGDFFQSVADFIERLKSEFSPEFENKGNGIILVLFFFAVFIHLIDLITNFNRGYLINSFLVFYLIYGFFFYFFTLPSDTFFKWDNLIFCFLLSLFSFFLPIPFIYLSKFFPWIIIFLVFTPVWPIFILYSFYNEVPIFKFLLNGYVLFWTIFFLIYFMANLPTIDGVSPVYKNTVDVQKAVSDYVFNDLVMNSMNVWQKIKEEANKLFDMAKSGQFSMFKLFFGKSMDEFFDYYIDKYTQVAMGLDTETTTVENITKPPDYGLGITEVQSILPSYLPNSNVRIFFQVQNFGVPKVLPFMVGCRMEDQKEEKPEDEKKVEKKESEEEKKTYTIGKVFPQFIEKEKVSICDYEKLDSCNNIIFYLDKDDSMDFECFFENVGGKDKRSVEIYVIYFSNFSSSLQYYVINETEALNLRKKKQNFFEAYKLKLPETVYDPKEPYRVRIGFFALPLISDLENRLEFVFEKTWTLDGEIFKIKNILINLNREFDLAYYENKDKNTLIKLDADAIDCEKKELTKYEKAVCNLKNKDIFRITLSTKETKPIQTNEVNIKGELIYIIKKGIEIQIESDEEKEDKK
ncbi:MAG: hypothetical protein QXS41_02385 [Candidatus Woesearchaeota archaeon]